MDKEAASKKTHLIKIDPSMLAETLSTQVESSVFTQVHPLVLLSHKFQV